MNRLKYLTIATISLAFSGVALTSMAFSPSQCAPFVNQSETQILGQSVSQKTVHLADQCVRYNACSALYSDPEKISICAGKLDTADYLVNYLFNKSYLSQNQPIIPSSTASANNSQLAPSFTASSPAKNSAATSTTNDAITPINLNNESNQNSNSQNSIHWF